MMPPSSRFARWRRETTALKSAPARIFGSRSIHAPTPLPFFVRPREVLDPGLALARRQRIGPHAGQVELLVGKRHGQYYMREEQRSGAEGCRGQDRPRCTLQPCTCTDSDQHRVAVAVEPISLLHRVPVRVEHQLAAGERADEHEQRRLRQVEVRQKSAQDLEVKSRVNEERRLPRVRPHAPAVFLRHRFKRPGRRRADGNDAAALVLRAGDCRCAARGDIEDLRVNRVRLDLVHANRRERAVADVHRDVGPLDAAGGELREQRRREMQPRGRRGDRSAGTRVDRLIPLAIRRAVGTLDVRRQRHVAQGVDGLIHVAAVRAAEPDRPSPEGVL